MTIHAICSLCKKKYNEKDDGKARVIESHGYCEKCLDVTMKDIRNTFESNRDKINNSPSGLS